jgi:hypothetical protein
MTTSRWAVLICRFADDTSVIPPLVHYQRLFTGAGTGSLNVVDYFREMSHGQLDLSDSQVFGPFGITKKLSDYPGFIDDRPGLFKMCKQAAVDGGVLVDTFDGIVVSMSGNVSGEPGRGVDLWGGPPGIMNAFCDTLSLSPSPLGQEMGHGYGLDHARQEGSDTDYMDPWDVMSVFDSAVMAPNAEWGTVGPGLNAQCMRSRGWLDEARVWRSSADSFDTVIQLRPLHRYDLPGVLAAELPGGFLVEYRPKERWDAAFNHSAVFVHSVQDNHSYVMRGTNGNFDLTAGDSFARGKQAGLFSVLAGSTKMDVVAIDDLNKTATIRLVHRSPFIEPSLVGSVTAGVAAGGSGLIFVGGKFRPVPPRGLANTILNGVAAYLDAAEITDSNLRAQVQRATLGAITRSIDTFVAKSGSVSTPAPLSGGPGNRGHAIE